VDNRRDGNNMNLRGTTPKIIATAKSYIRPTMISEEQQVLISLDQKAKVMTSPVTGQATSDRLRPILKLF
jgi:hypothetical protein